MTYHDSDYFLRLGIKNYNSIALSYSESLNRHSCLPYDDNGLFVVDKLSILFECTTSIQYLNYEGLVLEPIKGDATYINSYQVVVNGLSVGVLQHRHTSNSRQTRFDINNEIIYAETPAGIINVLMHIATQLDLKFSNYTNFEIAYDSLTNYLEKCCSLYYRSQNCSSYVHSSTNSEPLYRTKGSRSILIVVDQKDTTKGTYTEGSKNSATQVKVYDKTYENVGAKKYIQELHERHFGKESNVYRVEVTANSKAFNRGKALYGYDLADVLLPENLPQLFASLLGDKLVYRSIKPISHDSGRNPVYDEYKIVEFGLLKLKSVPLETHNNSSKTIPEFLHLLRFYNKGKIGLNAVVSFIKQDRNNEQALISTIKFFQRQSNTYLIDSELDELKKLLEGGLGIFSRIKWFIRFTLL